MRLEGQTKLGYYPTPDVTLSLLPTWLTVTDDGQLRRYLDPCCGKGEALAYIANGHAETYGIELSDVRAKVAEDKLTHVLSTAYEYAELTDETFSVCLLNPPYDGEAITGGGKRLEETFLVDRGTTSLLVSGGVLIYIIPHNRINEPVARHLAGWYSDLRCFKLPSDEYEAYKQVVIFGARRADYSTPKGETLSDVLAWRNGQCFAGYDEVEVPLEKEGQPQLDEAGQPKLHKTKRPRFEPLPELYAGKGEYTVPVSPQKGKRGSPMRWQYIAVSDEDYLREADDCATRLDASRDWLDLLPRTAPPIIEPAMTPKKGHIATQVSGGLLGTNLVKAASGEALLLKGNVTKYTVTHQAIIESEEVNESLVKVQTEERFKTLLSTLDADGILVTHEDPREIGRLLERYVEQLAEIVQVRNVPQYDMKPAPWEWAVFELLSRGRQLPGRTETGLTDFQKHLAIALGRLCLKHGAGFVNAEMGSGKTGIAIAIAEYIHTAQTRRSQFSAYPALVVGPGIVTGKENWPKEIPEVTPGADSRVVTVGAKPLPKPLKIGAWLKEVVGLTLDDDDFEGLNSAKVLKSILKLAGQQRISLSPPLQSALRQTLAQAEKNPPNRRKAARAPNLLDGRIGGFLWLGVDVPADPSSAATYASEYSVAQFIEEYGKGQLPEKSFAILSFETAKLASGRRSALNVGWRRVRMSDPESDATWFERMQICLCPQCGQAVAELYDDVTGEPDMATAILPEKVEQFIGTRRRFCQAPLRYYDPQQGRYLAGKQVLDLEMGKRVYRAHDENDQPFVCGSPLFEVSSLRRVAAAEYIKKKAKHVFGLCLIDECFPGETPVSTPDRGWVPISQIRPGDMVNSSANGEVVPKKVTRLLIRKLRGRLVTIHHSGGSLTCTSNHKIYTARGLVVAQELRQGDTLYGYTNMFDLQQGIPSKAPFRPKQELLTQLPTSLNQKTSRAHLPDVWAEILGQTFRQNNLLLQKLQCQVSSTQVSKGGLPEGRSSLIRADEDEQSNARSAGACQSDCQAKGASICPSGRKRNADRAAEKTSGSTRFRLASGISNYDGGEILEVRQARPSPTDPQDCSRGRWSVSYPSQAESHRSQENSDLSELRVEHIEIHQPGDLGECRGDSGDDPLVYNLEVEEAHNYFANGILVGNCHKAKAKSSGVGWALTILNNAARWTVGLTGTLFGGYSTSIFWLLYRLAAEVRREFGFHDERRWTEKYGLLKHQYYLDKEPAEDGAFTGTKFFETVSEKPGISPAIAGVGLKYCTFSSLKDIGLPLPDYSEEIVRLKMTSAMAEQYEDADGSHTQPISGLLKWALETQKDKDGTGRGAISVWLNTALHRPDAMFRPEEVWFNRRLKGKGKWAVRQKQHVRSYEPACNATLDDDTGEWLGDWLPKEQWAADTCWNERQRGRKTLLYLKQTGERDIQPRVKAALESRGLRVGILRPSIAPEKRATWMKRNADAFDVLLTNAKLVEVGLNLTMFSTAIFFELEYSLYTTWQAMRRLYRPGAPKPVKLYFPVYTSTLGEAALDLIGAKMMAAQCFYGDEVGGALVEEGDEGDLLNDLVRKALGQIEVGRAEGLFANGNGQMATESPLSSPTGVSPSLRTLESLLVRKHERLVRRAFSKKVAAIPTNQISLF